MRLWWGLIIQTDCQTDSHCNVSLLCQLHCLKVPQWTELMLVVLTYKVWPWTSASISCWWIYSTGELQGLSWSVFALTIIIDCMMQATHISQYTIMPCLPKCWCGIHQWKFWPCVAKTVRCINIAKLVRNDQWQAQGPTAGCCHLVNWMAWSQSHCRKPWKLHDDSSNRSATLLHSAWSESVWPRCMSLAPPSDDFFYIDRFEIKCASCRVQRIDVQQ